MPITIECDKESGIPVGLGRERLELDEIKSAATEMWNFCAEPGTRILWDLREARFDLSADDVRSLAAFVNHHAPPTLRRMAFVVSKDLEFGLVRMFETLREVSGSETWVFRDREAAVEWLDRDEA